jgi:hypothetical protein
MGQMPEARNFDLNIEKILDGWEASHAIRELIANALDEQILSDTGDIQINEAPDGSWHIRDYGRGLKYEHLTQNENPEKLKNPTRVIGKFGVGLKDALATLNRRGIGVSIQSKFNDISLTQAPKYGFSDVVTLQAAVQPPTDADFVGTEVILRGVTQADIDVAKNYFLKFSNETQLEDTPYGQILERHPTRSARIYVTGLLVAEEDNFAFSYNITSLTAAMRKALNRERTNVGRTAYSDRVKQMLLASKAQAVANTLASDLQSIELGTSHDEVRWVDVALHACQILNANERVMFVTASELVLYRDAVDHARGDGLRIVTVPDSIRSSLSGVSDIQGNPVRDLSVYQREWEDSFEFTFVDSGALLPAERAIYDRWKEILNLSRRVPSGIKSLKISETMRPDLATGSQTSGLWDPSSGAIIVKRSQLNSLAAFAGTVLHELVHARSGYADVSREFETALTELLGTVADSSLT